MTTILCVRKEQEVVMAGDGQVSMSSTIMKPSARKIRRTFNDVIEPDDGLIGIGSGGMYALAAARALMESSLSAREIAEKSMKIAADICIYTNDQITFEELSFEPAE